MVVSEIAAATLIAVCGLKRSYRIILRGERSIRARLKRPQPIITGYDSFPRSFIRHVFQAGHVIAMKWEGRAKNAAQRAADARLRAKRAGTLAAEDVRSRAAAVRERVRSEYHRRRSSKTPPKTSSGSSRVKDDGAKHFSAMVPPNKPIDDDFKMVRTRFR